MIRNLVRRLILWAVPEAGGYAEGGVVRPFQESQDPVRLVPRYHYGNRTFDNQKDLAEAMLKDGRNPYGDPYWDSYITRIREAFDGRARRART